MAGVIVTDIAVLLPFEGPAGDIVAGAVTAAAGRRVLYGAAAAAAH